MPERFQNLFNLFRLYRWTMFCVVVIGLLGASVCNAQVASAQSDLEQETTWEPVEVESIQSAFKKWSKDLELKAAETDQIHSLVEGRFDTDTSVDLIIDGMAIVRDDVKTFRDVLQAQRSSSRPPDFSSLLENEEESSFLRNHIRLYYGRWLAQNEFYDESLLYLGKLEVSNILDPSTLLFYRALMEHQLLKKEDCVKTAKQLLEHPERIPKRYHVLSKLVLADIEPLKEDSLDEVSRLMGDIRRRTGLHRSGKLVLGQEETVIKKLDKLIEELESQQQQQSAGSSAPSSPMQDSQNAAGQGSGEVTPKRQVEGGDWGDLPPAERAAALAEMAKDMPPHYRAVIEEYFRQLAKDNDR
jgi:hypothetical protein